MEIEPAVAKSIGHSSPVDLAAFAELGINNPAEIRKFLISFIEESSEDLGKMRMALAREDIVILHALAHRARSPAMMLGTAGFSNLCRALEDIKDTGGIGQAHGIVDQLDTELARIRKQIDYQ